MKLGDVYKKKERVGDIVIGGIIQIDSFARHISNEGELQIVYSHIGGSDGNYGSCPSFNNYGTVEEIEERYELLVPQESLNLYGGWDEIFKLIEE